MIIKERYGCIILKIFLIISAIILLLIFITLFSKVSGIVLYDDKNKLRLIVKLFFFKIQIYPFPLKKNKKKKSTSSSVSKTKEKEKTEEKIDVISTVKKAVFRFNDFLDIIRHKLTVSDFKLTAQIGTGDAAQTAILCGICYTAVYSVLGPLQNIFVINPPQILINPDYNGKTAKVEYSARIYARVITYIVIAVKSLRVLLSNNKK